MADKPSDGVPRHIEFGHDANAAVMRVGDKVASFVLGVEEAVRAEGVQLGESLAFNPEALIFGEVPMEDVHLHGFHPIDVAPDDIEGNEMAADIYHQTAPGEAWLILNFHGGGYEAVGTGSD